MDYAQVRFCAALFIEIGAMVSERENSVNQWRLHATELKQNNDIAIRSAQRLEEENKELEEKLQAQTLDIEEKSEMITFLRSQIANEAEGFSAAGQYILGGGEPSHSFSSPPQNIWESQATEALLDLQVAMSADDAGKKRMADGSPAGQQKKTKRRHQIEN
ncbi:hypothetical protein N3K66_009068 [Trichothecium roseum]|uniref:Uncharacterized protein n=1 Tax=Trichothecium roseum TaxID=47278 RepID=A0ACC0UPE6_9HYPO|nr:hypothetical protein N3K66_009068 [Trichothecium roseum]